MIEYAALLIFPLAMAYAAFSDLFTMTISNFISILLLAAFLVIAVALGLPWQQIGLHLACGVAVLAIGFTMFCFGWIGGGDAKLAAATAVWLGWSHLMSYGLIASIFGGLLTVVIVGARFNPLPGFLSRYAWIARLHDQKEGIPYGIALAGAGLVVYPQTQIWLATTFV
jgi:prepilin peptidase CpaA